MKFECLEGYEKSLVINTPSSALLFSFGNGDIGVAKYAWKDFSFCNEEYFDFQGFENALTGNNQDDWFTVKRFQVYQMN